MAGIDSVLVLLVYLRAQDLLFCLQRPEILVCSRAHFCLKCVEVCFCLQYTNLFCLQRDHFFFAVHFFHHSPEVYFENSVLDVSFLLSVKYFVCSKTFYLQHFL